MTQELSMREGHCETIPPLISNITVFAPGFLRCSFNTEGDNAHTENFWVLNMTA